MIPIDQTKFGADRHDPETAGDCYVACVASILEVPLGSLPHFCTLDPDWVAEMNKILAERFGLVILGVPLVDGAVSGYGAIADGTWCIISGKSPRGDWLHSTVGQYRFEGGICSLKFVHDPHPDHNFFGNEPPTEAEFFVCVDPSKRGDVEP